MSPPILFLVAAFIAVAAVGGYVVANSLDAASHARSHLILARDDLDAMLRIQLGQEIGLRGFLATGERSFLELEGPPTESFEVRSQRLTAELRDTRLAHSRAAAATLVRLHQRWKDEVESPLLADPKTGDALRRQQLGKTLTDQMQQEARTVRDRLAAADAAVEDELRQRINASVGVSVGTIALCAIAMLALGRARAVAVAALTREQSLLTALQQTLRVDGVRLPRTAVGFAYSSATREALIGGDLIDTWRVDEHAGWFLIADASGKGLDAARHAAFVQYAIRTLTAECDDPAAVVARFNRLFLATFDDPGIFVVLFLGRFDARTGELRYASAGHSIAFVVRPDGVEQLGPTGPIVGLDPGEVYTSRRLALARDDTVVLATDGLTESRDERGEMLGDDGVLLLLADGVGEPQALCDRLVAEARRRAKGAINDDLAILVLRIIDADPAQTGATFTTMTS